MEDKVCGKCNGEGNTYSALYDTWVTCIKCNGSGKEPVRPTKRAADVVETCADCRLQDTSSCPSLLGQKCQYFQPRR